MQGFTPPAYYLSPLRGWARRGLLTPPPCGHPLKRGTACRTLACRGAAVGRDLRLMRFRPFGTWPAGRSVFAYFRGQAGLAAALLEEGEDKTCGKVGLLLAGQNKRHTTTTVACLCVCNIIRCKVRKAGKYKIIYTPPVVLRHINLILSMIRFAFRGHKYRDIF